MELYVRVERPASGKERATDTFNEWTDRLTEAEERVGEAYAILAPLQRELRDAGRKQDAQALGEAVERLARYGRLFQDIKASWADPDQ
jgi:DNA repair ATPase RecN